MDICANSTSGTVGGDNQLCTVLEGGGRDSTEKTSVMLTFSKKMPWNGTAGETDLWREMHFVTSADLYTDGPPHREYLCLVPTPLQELI